MNSAMRWGLGIGWRPELALWIERRRDLGFVEVIAETLDSHCSPPAPLQALRGCGMAVILHGISLSLGGAEPSDRDRLAELSRLACRLEASLVSEHLAFVRAGDLEAGHLLPLPRTREVLDIVVENIRVAKGALPVPLAIENISTLFEWPESDVDEATFLAEVLERADVYLLLDVANLYANSRNHGLSPESFFDRIPLERIAYVHVGGGVVRDGLYHDTHAHPVPAAVYELLEGLLARVAVPGVMLERDDRFSGEEELNLELDRIAEAVSRGAARREGVHAC